MLSESDVERLFLQKAREWGYEDRRGQIHLTDLVSPCLRKLWFEKKDPLPDEPENTLRLWAGKIAHTMPLSEHSELQLEFCGVKTRIDEYLEDEKVLIEKKTAEFIPKDRGELERYYQHYIEQVNFETLFLIENGYDVRQSFLLFIKLESQVERGRRPLKAFEVIFDYEAVKSKFYERLENIKSVLSKDYPPDVPENFNFSDYPCSYCKYRARCW